MSSPVISVPKDMAIRNAAKCMLSESVSSLLVIEEGEYIAILTDADPAKIALANSIDPAVTPVTNIMNTPIITINLHQQIMEANKLMAEHSIRHLAVEDEGKIVGMLSIKDLYAFQLNNLNEDS